MIRNSRCKTCGGKIEFDPKSQKLYCSHCKNYQDVREEKIKLRDKINELELCLCPSCGAEMVSEDTSIISFCVYCKNNNIQTQKLTGEYKPQGIIPFRKTKEDAIEAFENMKQNQKLVPPDFLTKENIQEIRGIYIPFWLLDINVKGKMEAKTKITKMQTAAEVDVSYTETINEYENNREGEISYKMVPIDGSSHFDDDIMQCVEPFNYDEIKPYSSDYLAGFLAEIYDVSSDIAHECASKRIEKSAYEIFRKSLIGSTPTEIEVKKFDYTSQKVKEQFILLPVYLLNIKYKDKIHTFAMNGQTGKIVGNFPSDTINEIFYFIVVFLPLIFITQMISFLINKEFNIIGMIIGTLISVIIGYIFLKIERKSLEVIEKDPKINNYINDRIIENRQNTLINSKTKKHDTSRASQIVVSSALLGAYLASGMNINNK